MNNLIIRLLDRANVRKLAACFDDDAHSLNEARLLEEAAAEIRMLRKYLLDIEYTEPETRKGALASEALTKSETVHQSIDRL